jgi:hypothetical protein
VWDAGLSVCAVLNFAVYFRAVARDLASLASSPK